MPLGIYPRTKEQYEKIGKINSIKMKEYWKNNKGTAKQLEAIKNFHQAKEDKWGCQNPPETRKKISELWEHEIKVMDLDKFKRVLKGGYC